MGNYTGQLLQRKDPQKALNTEAIGFVLNSKEQKWNANQAKLDSALSQIGSVDLLRDKDKEHLLKNVETLLGNIKNTETMDLSTDSVSRGLENAVTSALDDYTVDQVINTRKVKNFQSSVQQIKEKNPELYSDANYAYSVNKSGLDTYLKGESDEVGQINYTPYTDVSSELDDIVKNIDKYADVVKESRPDGNGYIVKKEGKILTPEKLRVLAENSLSQNARNQMSINGWYNYDRGVAPTEQISQQFEAFSQGQLGDVDAQINSLKVRLKNTNNISTKQDINSNIKTLQEYRTNLSDQYNKWQQSGARDNMTSTMEKEQYLDRFSKSFAIDNINTTYEEDRTFSKKQDLQYKINSKLLGKSGTSPKDTDLDGQNDVQQVRIPQQITQDTINPTDNLRDSIKGAETAFVQNTESVFNNLPQEVQEDINRTVGDKDRSEYIADYLDNKVLESSNIVSISTVKQLQDLKNRKTFLQNRYNKAVDEATEETEQEVFSGLFDVVRNNEGIKVATENGNQSYSQYLNRRGIDSFEKLKADENEFEKFKKQTYADYILSSNEPTEFNIRRLAKMFGEETEEIPVSTADPTYTSVGGALVQSRGTTRLSENPGTMKKTVAFLKEVRAKGAYDTSYGFQDDSIQDDATGRKLLAPQNIQEKVNSRLGDTTNDLAQDYSVRIQPDTDIHDALLSVVSDATTGGGSFIGEDKIPLSILPDEDPAYVNIIQTQEIGSGKDKTIGAVPKRELIANLPDIVRNEINFYNTKELFTKENAPNVERKVMFGEAADYRRVRDITKNVTGNEDVAYLTTKEGTIGNLKQSYPQLFSEGQGYDIMLDTVTSDENFKVVMETKDGETYTSIKYNKNGSEENIYTFPEFVEEENFNTAYNNVKYVPQLYMHRMLDIALSDSATKPNQPNPIIQNILKIYNGD